MTAKKKPADWFDPNTSKPTTAPNVVTKPLPKAKGDKPES